MSTTNNPTPDQDQVIKGHNYDGIQEYDNPMPGWWVWIFWATIIFSGYYVLGIEVFDTVDTYEEDLAQSQAELQEIRDTYAAENEVFEPSEEAIAAYIGDEAKITAGSTTYATYCAACHGNVGQGLIGPNLTDDYWLYDNDNVTIFNIITNGIVDKGMTPWGGILTPEQRAEVVAYLRTLEGTDPPDAKEAQGEFMEPYSI